MFNKGNMNNNNQIEIFISNSRLFSIDLSVRYPILFRYDTNKIIILKDQLKRKRCYEIERIFMNIKDERTCEH